MDTPNGPLNYTIIQYVPRYQLEYVIVIKA